MAKKTKKTPASVPWSNRIVRYGEEAPQALTSNPRNWRVHPDAQQEALEAVLNKVGWVDAVKVNHRTGVIVDGHARVGLAVKRNEATVPVCYVEITDEEEALVLATFDRITELADLDREKLDALIAEAIDNMPDMAKVLEDIDALLMEDATEDSGTSGDSLPQEGDAAVSTQPAGYGVVIECDNEGQQIRLLQRFIDEGFRCRAMIS